MSCCAVQIGVMSVFASTMGVFIPEVSASLGISTASFSVYSTINSLTMMVLYPIAGKLLTKYDIRLTASLPVIGTALGFVTMSRFTAVWQFYLAAFWNGACLSFVMFLLVPILLNNWFQEKLGLAMGISLSCSGIGGMIFCALAGQVIQNSGWRTAYVVLAACGAAIVLPFTLFVIRLRPADKGLLPYGAGEAGANTVDHAQAGGITCQEAKKMPAYWLLLVFSGAMGLISGIQSMMTTFARSLGHSMDKASLATSMVMFGVMIGKLLIGRMNDKLGTSKALTVLYAPSLIAVVLLLISSLGQGGSLIFAAAALCGLPVAISSMEPAILVRARFGNRDYAAIYSRIQQAFSLCGAFAQPFYLNLYEASGGFTVTFTMALAVLTVSFVSFRTAFKK